MAVVVRCTECRGASQVGPEAAGLHVVCPHCHAPFVAIEEAPLAAKTVAKPRPVPSPLARPRPRPRRIIAEPVHAHVSSNPHDAPLPSSGGLPVSVLFGFALLPLAIPLLWLIGPHLLSKPPALTLAAPISLAVAASVLCLAVVFTVDWTPMTRIKGVLILVGLSYFAGLSLYFLKKDLVERVRDFLTPEERWHDFREPGGAFTLSTPGRPREVGTQPLDGWKLKCFEASSLSLTNKSTLFVFASGPDVRGDSNKWFDEVGQGIESEAGKASKVQEFSDVRSWEGVPGRQWVIDLANDKTRVVRVFRADRTVYYLAVEGELVDTDSVSANRFFDSFHIGPPRK